MRIKVDASKLPKVPYSKPEKQKPEEPENEIKADEEKEEPKKKKRDWSKVRRGNRSRFYTAAQDNVIREMRANGKSFQEIADQLGRTKEAVRKRAQVIL